MEEKQQRERTKQNKGDDGVKAISLFDELETPIKTAFL